MSKTSQSNHIFQAFMMVVAISAFPIGFALAQAVAGGIDLGSAAMHIATQQIGPIAPLISALFWVVGGVLIGAGALKLKEHAENPTQTPMRHGIARMAVGAVLMTIPFFSQFVINTLSNVATPAIYTPFAP